MTKFVVNNRTDASKTVVNLFFYVKKLSNCPLSLVDALHKIINSCVFLHIDNEN